MIKSFRQFYTILVSVLRRRSRISNFQTAATITVSKFFTDKHAGAATDRTGSSEDSSRRQRTLLQRLHIHTSIKRGKSPVPLRPSTASAALGGGSPSPRAVRASPSTSDAADIEEITRMMPQSLIIGNAQREKRQRSADGRLVEGYEHGLDHEHKEANVVTGTTPSKPSIRMPPYLEKSRSGKSIEPSDHRNLPSHRDSVNFPGGGVEAAFPIISCYAKSGKFAVSNRQI